MFISVLVLTTPFLFINFPQLPAQTFIPTTQHYKPALHTQSQLTKYMQSPSTVTQHLNITLPPTDSGALTHLETSSAPLSESKTPETTIHPVPETTLLPISTTTLSVFQETESGPQVKRTSTIKNYTTLHISTVPAPITTSRPQHFKTSASTSGPQHFKTSDSTTSGPQHFKTSDSTTSGRQHFRTSDSPTSGPQELNISDARNFSVSLDKKTHKTDVDTTIATFTVIKVQSTDVKDSHEAEKLTWLWVIIIIFCIICMGGGFICILVRLLKKKRSENLSTSFKNGGSYNKKKKNPVNDAWAGPMPARGEKEMEEGGEEEEEVQEKSKEGDEERMVLSTFTTIQEGKAEPLGGNLGENEADNKVEVPLLQSTKDGGESDPLTASLSSPLLPPVGDDGEGEQDGQTFCLTTAV